MVVLPLQRFPSKTPVPAAVAVSSKPSFTVHVEDEQAMV